MRPLPGMTLIGPLAYRGKEGCRDVRCTRSGGKTVCFGWHCSYCDEPCSSMGHRCDAAKAVLEASEAVLREQGKIPAAASPPEDNSDG